MLILYPATLLKVFITSKISGTEKYTIISSANMGNLTSFLMVSLLFLSLAVLLWLGVQRIY
jgi:hypothetical protein